jgi:cytochrome P450
LLSLLVRANTATDPRERLSDTDVLARKFNYDTLGHAYVFDYLQITEIPTFLVAGHETSASMMSWLFLELASNPSIQSALRAECLANPLRVRTTSQNSDSNSGFKGEAEPLDAAELSALDKLPLLDAVVRETLRLHSPVPCVHRAATRDDVIPLDKPYVDRDGVTRENVTIHKGDTLYISILLVDRMVALWGPDAGQWKPERWMDGKGLPEAVKNVPGVWGNLMTFLGGGRACIGFKFSLYE